MGINVRGKAKLKVIAAEPVTGPMKDSWFCDPERIHKMVIPEEETKG